MTRPISMAVVGLGYWGPNLVRCLHEIDGVEVKWICDLRSDLLHKVGRRYPAVGRTASYHEVIEDADLDAVLIATPVSTHYALAQGALEAGKHVFVEKPLAGSAAESTELLALAEERGLLLMPGHTFVYSPPVAQIKGLIDSGELGDVHFISTSRVNLGLHQPDVSVAWDLAPHDFSILRYWLDQTPSHLSALSRSCVFPGIPDVAFINLEFPSGTIAHVEIAWLAPSKLRRTTIVGSRKMVVYDDTSAEPIRIFDSGVVLKEPESFGEYRLTYRTGDILSPPVDPAEPLGIELGDFCQSIRDGSEPRSNARLGVEVVRMIEAVDASLEQRGARMEIEGTPAKVSGS